MNKYIKILILSIFIIIIILIIGGFSRSAFAVNTIEQPLVVHFENEPEPLFNEANFAPGNEVLRTIEVANNSGATQNIIIEATNAIDTGGLGDKLHLTIKEGEVSRYFGTLGAFLRAGEVSLSSLSNSTSTLYSFGVTFSTDADNDLQNKNLGFDLCVGFQGGDTRCGDTVISGENGGGGGSSTSGSGGNTITLVIYNEQAINVSNVGASGVATITWNTNKLSTSQVIYGLSPGPYNLNLNTLPNLGYPLGSVEDANKVINHSVTLSGLIPGATYVYRVVSHASPATVSYEHSFTVPILAQVEKNNIPNNNGQVLGAQDEQQVLNEDNDAPSDNNEKAGSMDTYNNLLGASAGNIMWLSNPSFWLVLIILLFLIILIIIYRRKNKKDIG